MEEESATFDANRHSDKVPTIIDHFRLRCYNVVILKKGALT